jgi:hypothetical protein
MRRCLCAIVLMGCVAAATAAAEKTELAEPISADVFLRTGSPARLIGQLVRYDDQSLVIQTRTDERELKWTDLTPGSAFVLRSRVIDRNNAGDWFSLGQLGWALGAKDQARTALSRASRMDPSLEPKVKQVLASPAGGAAPQVPAIEAPTAAPVPERELSQPPLQRYVKPTPEQDAAAIARAQRFGQSIAKQFEVDLVEVQTQHFIIFTDWDPREHNFLKTNVEAAYAAVAKQFEVPVGENIFVGKLPIFMFARKNDFNRFAAEHAPGLGGELAGYYASHGDGTGHMGMWKPDIVRSGGNVRAAEREWAYTLTHEFTHAFIDRYLSNRRVPRWMNEGIAEVIAQTHFSRGSPGNQVRLMASRGGDIAYLFDDGHVPSWEHYAIMQTLVETLIARDRKAFFEMFRGIKDGMKPEEALRKFYGWDYDQLVAAWRIFVRTR